MRTTHKIGLGALILVTGASLLAMRPEKSNEPDAQVSRAHLKLASGSTEARRDIDYAAIDRRLQQLMDKPAMVGLAVGIVENGRITFLKGYGETLAGSDEAVTPATVFRWASVSKGVASTMVAKLAHWFVPSHLCHLSCENGGHLACVFRGSFEPLAQRRMRMPALAVLEIE